MEDIDECQNFWNTYSGFQNIQRVLLPINDTMIVGNLGREYQPLGTHWSLLVIDIEKRN